MLKIVVLFNIFGEILIPYIVYNFFMNRMFKRTECICNKSHL